MKKIILISILILIPLSAGCMMNQQGPSFEPSQEGMGWDFGDKLNINARFVASPILVDNQIYVPSLDGNIYAFDSEKGKLINKEIWSYKSQQGIRSTPAHHDGILYFGSYDMNVYGIDIKSGQIRFTWETKGYVSASPLIVDGILFIGSNDGVFRAINLSANRTEWELKTKFKIKGGAVASETGIIFGNEDGTLFHINRSDGSEIWQAQVCGEIYGSPVIKDTMVIVADLAGCVSAINIDDGSLLWKYKSEYENQNVNEEFWTAPVCDDNAVFIGSSHGQFHALKLYPSSEAGESYWETPMQTENGGIDQYGIMSEAVIHDGKVIFGSNGAKLFCLDALTGAELWTFATLEEIRCRPLIIDNKVIFISNDHYLYGLNIEDGTPVRG